MIQAQGAQSRDRYVEDVAGVMRVIPGALFAMGTADSEVRHFCGEAPLHDVELSSFAISGVPVTNALFSLFDPQRRGVPVEDRELPVTTVTWSEAARFAEWMDCRLPTEAEWEYACGAGAESEWCCDSEAELERYAWFSENSNDRLHGVGTREPNSLSLFDLHGHVWEWCADAYDQDYYRRAPRLDPLNAGSGARDHRVCRGGSIFALPEMCRTQYRFHEPREFWAADLGFRLARDV